MYRDGQHGVRDKDGQRPKTSFVCWLDAGPVLENGHFSINWIFAILFKSFLGHPSQEASTFDTDA